MFDTYWSFFASETAIKRGEEAIKSFVDFEQSDYTPEDKRRRLMGIIAQEELAIRLMLPRPIWGKSDDHCDFVINEQVWDLKLGYSNKEKIYKTQEVLNHYSFVYSSQITERVDVFLFAVNNGKPEGAISILGAISRPDFLRNARLFRKGDRYFYSDKGCYLRDNHAIQNKLLTPIEGLKDIENWRWNR